MDKLTYQGFRELVSKSHTYSDSGLYKYKEIIRFTDEYLNDVEVIGFYPKNLFRQNQGLQMYLFLSSKKILIVNYLRHEIGAQILKIENIKKATYHRDENHTFEISTKLEITFNDDTSINFNSLEDTNESWREQFAESIKNIFSII